MKIKALQLVILMLLTVASASSQTLEEFQKHLDLVNGLHKQIAAGKVADAVDATHKIFAFRPDLMDLNLHASIARGIEREDQATREYLRLLAASNSKELNRLIEPLRIWDRSIHTNNLDSLKVIKQALLQSLNDQANIHSKPELYALMTLRRLGPTGAITKTEHTEILRKIIGNLKQGTVEGEIADRATIERRAWSRYLISYSYNELYQITPEVDLLYQAATFSPDMSDRSLSNAYFYDAVTLGHDDPLTDFRQKYLKHLLGSGKKDEALSFLTQMAFIDPTGMNRQAAADYYTKELGKTDFPTYWKNYLNASGRPLPAIELKFGDKTLDFKSAGKWTLLDVWGTWCSPCIRELPEIQKFYTASLIEKDYPEVYTISYSSTKLPEFMLKNNYTFPVSEVDKKTIQSLSVIGFPTKILITPERMALKIPFNSDWKQIMRTYMMGD